MKNKNMLRLSGIMLISLLLCSLLWAGEEKAELKFSHKLHVMDQEIECASCHEAAENSVTGKDNLMPTMEACSGCHDVEAEAGCNLCHSDLENPRNVPRISKYSEKFSHKGHLAADLNCSHCHADVAKKEMVEPYLLPTMAMCMDCHENKSVSNECAACHMPGEKLKPMTHGLDFLHAHGDLARTGQATKITAQSCKTCHSVNYCQECHEGDNLDRMTHPLNYEFTHSLEAMGREKDCAVCHTERSFCNDCHRDYNLMPHNHTAGWSNRVDGGRHRWEAQSDLESCMTCHEQNADQICQTCHSK